MRRAQIGTLVRILCSAVLLVAAELSPLEGLLRLAAFLIPFALVGADIVATAVRSIFSGQVFNENLLMSIACIGALATAQYAEAVFVMLFYQVGELFQRYAVGKSRHSITQLMQLRPDSANVERDGALETVDPEEVAVGEVILVKPGEKIPLDGTVLDGSSALDTAALTGESLPRDVAWGDAVLSGCVNLAGPLRIEVTKPFEESTVSKMLELVENAGAKKAKTERFITRFARYYTPAVVFAAIALAVIPSLFDGNWGQWLSRALVFLVVSCPCALVISVPLSFFGGIGGASKAGILIKGGNYLEVLARADTMAFDKTGTLTRGSFQVTALRPAQGYENAELLELAALAEHFSNHAIARSIRAACPIPPHPERLGGDVEECAGMGVRAEIDGQTVYVGNRRLLVDAGIPCPAAEGGGAAVYVGADGRYVGYLLIADAVKPGAAQAVASLKAVGIRKTVMLTGDTEAAARAVAQTVGIDEIHASLLPADKVEAVENLLREVPRGGSLAYVGDGINDAPVLSRADVGIAMGALGSDAAMEAADIVLMDDDPCKLPVAITIARKTMRIVTQNIVFALGVKVLVLVLSALGFVSMWAAVFADVGVAVIAILNAMRALRPPVQASAPPAPAQDAELP
ncbi:MAG: cadmium-translocating P-type ATPase [Oscillospiraceae bacterium]|nr:cadmium-translocating P-type ATPase [Oscillospiraceae bacterium]